MIIQPKPATARGPAETFTGDVWVDAIAAPQTDGQRMVVARVRFSPGARTAWHSHARGQTLHITEEHWHGATPADFMEHLAMLDNADDPAATTRWLEHVTDTQYNTPITAEE